MFADKNLKSRVEIHKHPLDFFEPSVGVEDRAERLQSAAGNRANTIWGLKIYLLVLLPSIFFVHGLFWTYRGENIALLVYGAKLSSIITFIPVLFSCKPLSIFRRENGYLLLILASLLVIGLVTPFIIGGQINWFYFASDTIGVIVTFLYIFCVYFFLISERLSLTTLLALLFKSMGLVCLGISINYMLSRGGKVSIPSEIHYALAIYIAAGLSGFILKFYHTVTFGAIVAAGVVMAQLRINLIVAAAAIICTIVWRFLVGKWRFNTVKLCGCIFLCAAIVHTFSDQLVDRIQSLNIVGDDLQFEFTDSSANQRFSEASLIFRELESAPFYTFFTGKGFGALYANTHSLIPHYGERQHHAHMTPLVVLLRHGLFGLIIYMVPLLLATRTLFTRCRILFTVSLGVVLSYIALMSDQYLYWSPTFGTAVALLLYVRRIR
jgi:hypothetical protein